MVSNFDGSAVWRSYLSTYLSIFINNNCPFNGVHAVTKEDPVSALQLPLLEDFDLRVLDWDSDRDSF